MEQVNLSEIIKANPQVDIEELRENMNLLEELRASGMPQREYQLNPPFATKRVQVTGYPQDDPRMVYLNRP